MSYFYQWYRGERLFVHSGKLVKRDNEYVFETDDGSGKVYLHCSYDHTYSRNQVITETLDDLIAVEKLIENYEHLIEQYNNAVTKSMERSLKNLKALRSRLKGNSPKKEATKCMFCTTNEESREPLIKLDLNLGIAGNIKISSYIKLNNQYTPTLFSTVTTPKDNKSYSMNNIFIKYCPVCGRKLED